ncbi:MAG: ATP phosphoribosyltransferase regulatory subunit, partial [Pseudomonadota bacterium]
MTLADCVADALAQSGGDRVEPNVLIEARVPLELSGEAVRSRICTFVDDNGVEWALRPDLTLPVALAEIAERRSGDRPEAIRHYRGPVFRLPALP